MHRENRTHHLMSSLRTTLEGFTLHTLAEELSPLTLSSSQLNSIAKMIAVRGGCDVFPSSNSTRQESLVSSCLVEGRCRTIILGSGDSVPCFREGKKEHLMFFPKPGWAGRTTLTVDIIHGDTSSHSSRLRALLTRDERYQYSIDGRLIQVIEANGEQVQCMFTQPATGLLARIALQANVFWPFVFGTSPSPKALIGAQISAAHTAAILGLSLLTIERRIGEGKLPAVRLHSKYPGVCLSGLREFLAYRKQFPQGHPQMRRIAAWQQEWRQTYNAEVQCWLEGEPAGTHFLLNTKEHGYHR